MLTESELMQLKCFIRKTKIYFTEAVKVKAVEGTKNPTTKKT